MATSPNSQKAPCVACSKKNAGIFRCEGCLKLFCRLHLNEHRDILNHQLENIIQEHDTLQQTIFEYECQDKHEPAVFKQIDQWEKNSIVKIQLTAEQARMQAKLLTSFKEATNELRQLADKLAQARVDDDYVEADLCTWKTILEKLRDDIHMSSTSISIEEDPKEILVNKISVSTRKRQLEEIVTFGESYGPIRIENNASLVVHVGKENSTACVRTANKYSFGKHRIRFLFKKNSTRYITEFGIMPSLMPIGCMTSSTYNCYGWSSDNIIQKCDNENGTNKTFRNTIEEISFDILLELDCDNQMIRCINQETKDQKELYINTTKCPFPWHVRFYLFEIGDSVLLLTQQN